MGPARVRGGRQVRHGPDPAEMPGQRDRQGGRGRGRAPPSVTPVRLAAGHRDGGRERLALGTRAVTIQ
jgi:hypothetical protein